MSSRTRSASLRAARSRRCCPTGRSVWRSCDGSSPTRAPCCSSPPRGACGRRRWSGCPSCPRRYKSRTMVDSPYLVTPGSKFKLADYHTGDTGKFKDKAEAAPATQKNVERLGELQELLYAEA